MKFLEEHTWKTIEPYFSQVYPELAKIINSISPPDTHKLYIAKYPYGALILNKGIFHILNDLGGLVPLADQSIPKAIQEDLTYTGTMPMGMVSKNSIETFFFSERRGTPSSSTLFSEKGMIALWCALEEGQTYQAGPIWNVSSGARTICMLPKITDKGGYKNLNFKYKLKLEAPNSLYDHWDIFKKLANHSDFPQHWYSELIFFSKHWFEHKQDESWVRLYQFYIDLVWKASVFRRNQYIVDFAFSLLQENMNLKPNPYLADTARHLIAVCAGEVLGLSPAIDNEAAPIYGLQKVFAEDYGLKKYLPIIMHSHHFSLSEKRPVYYSLTMPITTIFSPRSSQVESKMVDMRELRDIVLSFRTEILKGHLKIEKTPIWNFLNSTNYGFYHSGHDQFAEIMTTDNLLKQDQNLIKTVYSHADLAFPEFSSFFNGCVSLINTAP